MRYNVKRWYEDASKQPELLEDCEELEVVKQVIEAIDRDQNFEAVIVGPKEACDGKSS